MAPSHLTAVIFALFLCAGFCFGQVARKPAPVPVASSYVTDPRELLRGLQGVYVEIEALDPDAERDGLTKDRLQTDVELRLHKAGIQVLTKKQWLDAPGSPYLYVEVGTIKEREGALAGLYTYSLTVSLSQKVTLARNPSMTRHAPTWGVDAIGSVGADNLQSISDRLGNLVDKFIKDYLAVNPR